MRERVEQYARDLEAEMERLKLRHMGRADSSAVAELTEEIVRYLCHFLHGQFMSH